MVEESVEEEGIVFQAAEESRGSREDGNEMTAVESILPWRRKSSFAPDDQSEEDNLSLVLKQQEFPAWIGNKQYLSQYASPTTTVIQALDRDRSPRIAHLFADDTNHTAGATDEPAAGTAVRGERKERKARTQTSDRASSTRTSEDNEQLGADNPAFVPDDAPVTKL